MQLGDLEQCRATMSKLLVWVYFNSSLQRWSMSTGTFKSTRDFLEVLTHYLSAIWDEVLVTCTCTYHSTRAHYSGTHPDSNTYVPLYSTHVDEHIYKRVHLLLHDNNLTDSWSNFAGIIRDLLRDRFPTRAHDGSCTQQFNNVSSSTSPWFPITVVIEVKNVFKGTSLTH